MTGPHGHEREPGSVWPVALATGLVLALAGLLVSRALLVAGAFLALAAVIGLVLTGEE